jgi:membrane protease YdiL (CAAX protease family)
MLDHISISGIPLFSRLSAAQLNRVERLIRVATYQPGEMVIEEGSPAACLLYIIIAGEAALCKRGRSPLTDRPLDYEIEVRGRNDLFGWISVLDGRPLPMTVMARTPLTVATLDLKRGDPGSPSRHIRNVLITELRRYLSCDLRTSLEYRVASLQHEAEFARYRNAVGSIVITALALLSFYTLALSMLPRFESVLEVNFALSAIIIVFFAAFFIPVIKRSGFPGAFFGLRFDNWRTALPFAAAASVAFLAIVVFIKWLLIATLPRLHGLELISFADIRIGKQDRTDTPWYWVALSLYLLLTPVQEFVARCGIQAPLYAFLQGSEFRRGGLSIIVSNLVFSAVHAHIGLGFALVSFVPGLFWGWIFLRTNSLLAASASHILIGGAGVFLLGMEEFLRQFA